MDLKEAVKKARKWRKEGLGGTVTSIALLDALEKAAPIIEELQNECSRIDAKHGGRDAEYDVSAPMAKAMLFGRVLRAAGLPGDQWEVRLTAYNEWAIEKDGNTVASFMKRELAEEYVALMRAKD